MTDPIATDGLSPLDQIRLAEAEVTRKVIAARERAERAVNEAREQARLLKKQAQQAGTLAGQKQYKEIITQAEEEGRLLIEHAQAQIAEMRQKGPGLMEFAIQEALALILGVRMEGGDES